ncbi:Ribonuclease kappa-B-like 1 [Homarus americanus]|uniref:Ribonuclease kappa-B-like 1 n=1 Tax=Homarus americanus TaxID=6706 RepID=A0A8J5JIR4_HOMAM|nr:Ribonuclease kappa-B-like 1 [Homarus americanus]
MAFCGYKLSLCVLIISVWGLFQLLIMGVFFYTENASFLEDLPIDGTFENTKNYMDLVRRGFKTNAFNCFIAACLYIATLGVSAWQFYLNQKTTYQV